MHYVVKCEVDRGIARPREKALLLVVRRLSLHQVDGAVAAEWQMGRVGARDGGSYVCC